MDLSSGTIADIGELRRAEAALAVRLRYEAGLAAFSTALIERQPDASRAIDQALRHLLEAANSSRVYIAENFELPEGGIGMRLTHEACAPGVHPEIHNPSLQHGNYAKGWQRWLDTFVRGDAVAGSVASFPEGERIFLQKQSILSILVLPILLDGQVYGFIGFDDCESERTWDDGDVRLLRTAAEILASHLQRQRAETALLSRFEQLHAVFLLSETAGRAASLDDIYKAVLDSLHQAAGADRAAVLLFDADGIVRFKAWLGLSAAYRNAVEGHTPWSPDAHDAEPILTNNIATDPSLAIVLPRTGEPLFDTVQREGIQALGMIPLLYQDRLLGKFMVYYDTPHNFRVEEVRFLQTLAGTIAFAIVRKQSEEALRQSEQRYRLFLQNFTGIAYQVECIPGRPTLFEGAVTEITGYSAESFLRSDVRWFDLIDARDNQRIETRGNWLFQTAGATLDDEYRVVHRDGGVRWVRDIARHVVDETTGRHFVQGAIYDMTDRKRAEEERLEMERRLLHAQKLESLGVLAGGIAHDFNNLLLAIGGNLEVAQFRLQDDSAVGKYLDRAMAAIQSASGLAQQMLAYSGRAQFVVKPVNLSALVEENSNLLRAAVTRNRELELHLNPALPTIQADPSQMHQVILNLITNAAEATPDSGGRIILTTGMQQFEAEDLALSRGIDKPLPGVYVYLQVEDNGSGMPEDVQQRLFEPFFTTKFSGRGLGMAAVLGIVRGHHGAILVESTPQVGTCVRVLLPSAWPDAEPLNLRLLTGAGEPVAPSPNESSGESPVESPSESPSGTSKTISGATVLVADDEPLVRSMCQSLMEEWGYTVLLAADGAEAVAVYRQHAAEITCSILDLTMPRMDGISALHAIRAIEPNAQAILSSGFSEHEVSERFSADKLTMFLQKPYRAETLRQTLELCINAAR
jgi:PAS domain S-box-containing protein